MTRGRAISPKPRLALAVGVTGHRPNLLPDSSHDTVAETIAEILSAMRDAMTAIRDEEATVFSDQEPCLSLISNLAEGTDRIASETALSVGLDLEVVLPFSADLYEQDFESGESVQSFRDLIGRASRVLALPGDRNDAPRAYEMAGRTMLDHSALLIAVWNGKPAAGRGGTQTVIADATRRGIPVIVIDAEQPTRSRLSWAGLAKHPDLQEHLDDLVSDDTAIALPNVVKDLVAPPGARDNGKASEKKHLEDYFADGGHRTWIRPEWPVLLAMTGIRSFRASACRPTDPAAAERQSGFPEDDAGGRCLAKAFGWADAVATDHAQIFRSAFVANFVLAALAVFVVALSIFFKDAIQFASEKWPFVIVEVLLIGFLLANTALGRRRDWHRRWLESREIAERLRVALPMRQLFTVQFEGSAHPSSWTAWYARAVLREAGLPQGDLKFGAIPGGITSLKAMLKSQRKYHELRVKEMSRLDHRLEKVGELLFIATLVVACAFLMVKGVEAAFGGYLADADLPEFVSALLKVLSGDSFKYTVTACTAGFPVLATATYGIRVIGDFEGIVQRSERMAARLQDLEAALNTDAGNDLRRARDRARQAATIILGDVANWRLSAESRGLAIPG